MIPTKDDPTPAPRTWGVAALVRALADALDARFNPITVRGEITGFSRASSGHCYFTLKEHDTAAGEGALSCAMFRRVAGLIDFSPKNGDVVELRGRVGVYEARGSLQLVVEHLRIAQPDKGALWARFERLKAQLAQEGLFDADRKRPIPRFVRHVAVLTSLQAAALQDVKTALARRVPHVQVSLVPCAVQGAAAVPDIVDALSKVELYNTKTRRHPADLLQKAARSIDAVLLVRGGGSLEDLWAFNEEAVVRAVAACSVPLICGVGHETDFSLCDFAADVRAPTPTAAAELLSEPTAVWVGALAQLQAQLRDAVFNRIDRGQQRLDQAAQRLGRPAQALHQQRLRLGVLQTRLLAAPAARLRAAQERCARATSVLPQAANRGVQLRTQRLANAAGRLQALSPQRVLERGYAWLEVAPGQPATHVARLAPGMAVRAVLADGSAQLQVSSVAPNTPSG